MRERPQSALPFPNILTSSAHCAVLLRHRLSARVSRLKGGAAISEWQIVLTPPSSRDRNPTAYVAGSLETIK